MQDSFFSNQMTLNCHVLDKFAVNHDFSTIGPSLGTLLQVAVYQKCMACNTLSDSPTMSYGEMCFCQFEYTEQNTPHAKLTFLVRFPLLAISNTHIPLDDVSATLMAITEFL